MQTKRVTKILVLFTGFILLGYILLAWSAPSANAARLGEENGLSMLVLAAPLATRTITNTNDSGVGSLRAQILAAVSDDTIVFEPTLFSTPVTITLTTGWITIDKNLTIDATSVAMPTISGNNSSRVFEVRPGASVTMTKLAIVNGNCISCDGGGIHNRGSLVVTNSTFLGNSATNTGYGGGIFNIGALTVMNSTFLGNRASTAFGGGIFTNGTLALINSTLSGNSSGTGGGIFNWGMLAVTNSTFSGNSAVGGPGGGVYSDGTLTVTNSTFSGNSALNGGGIYRGGTGTATFKNTIVANSISGDNCYGTITDGGYNLDSGTACGFSPANNSLNSTDPRLAPLGNYGGATHTFALLADSPAINHIPNGTNGCGTTITTDQRGVSRPQGGACDIGTYEANNIVKNLSDSGAGSLRQVVLGVLSGDLVLFDPVVFATPVTITLTTGQITLDKNVTIDATSVAMPSISGNNASRVFWVNAGVSVTMTKLTIVNGYCGSCLGGSIYSAGKLVVGNSTFSGNSAIGGNGGGIYNYGTLAVANCSFLGNSAGNGGGISNDSTLTVMNSTFSGNSASQSGGGLDNWDGTLAVTNTTFSGNSAVYGGGIINTGRLTVTNSTLSGNSASISGGGIRNSEAATFKNTIVANSTSGGNCGGVITNGGYNMDSGTSCGFSSANNSLSSTDPGLAPLGNYGGATQTFAILGTSPAVNRIPNGTNACGTAITTDQRGVSRPQMSACDIGAYEWNSIVKNTNNNGEWSLRQIVADAPAGDHVLFDPAVFSTPVTITLTTGPIALGKNVTIDATSVMTPSISGNNASRIFSVSAGVSVTMTKLVIVNGNCGVSCSGGGGGIYNSGTLAVMNCFFLGNSAPTLYGGGINNQSTLRVTNSTFSGNSANQGGGIYNASMLTVTNSTFSGNSATYGGGIYNMNALTVTNSTFSGNSAINWGGGVSTHGGTLTVTNSTFSGNTATTGGGIRIIGSATFKNTIVANSTSGDNCNGTITDGGYNLDSGTTCSFSSANNSLSNTNPLLRPLGNYGGPTQTFALLIGSPAINQIPNGTNGCGTTISTDQRGVKRPIGLRCEIGAYEAYEYLFLPLIRR